MIIIVLFSLIFPVHSYAEPAPSDPPEMPDWFKDKFCKNKSSSDCADAVNDDFKGKDIKTKVKPKPVNPTPVGVGVGLITNYLLSQSEYAQDVQDKIFNKIDDLDQAGYQYLADRGIEGWDDIFELVGNGAIKFKDNFINAYKNFFAEEEIDFGWHHLFKYDGLYTSFKNSTSHLDVIEIIGPNYVDGNILSIYFMSVDGRNYSAQRTLVDYKDYPSNGMTILTQITRRDYDQVKEFFDSVTWGNVSTFFGLVNQYQNEFYEEKDLNYTINNSGTLTNPFGSRLLNPNDMHKINDMEHGVIEIDGTDYDIINVPNPNHTPHLPSDHPDYIPDKYPIINPVNPDLPNNPNPGPNPDIPLIPGITPSPGGNPNPNPNPDPDPNPNPNPDPFPVPDPPPGEGFPDGDTCGKLELDLKSVDLFTTKFPFSLPWDVFNGINALFGSMGDNPPEFTFTVYGTDIDIVIPDFILDAKGFINSIILFIFDIGMIYALYRLFGGAS